MSTERQILRIEARMGGEAIKYQLSWLKASRALRNERSIGAIEQPACLIKLRPGAIASLPNDTIKSNRELGAERREYNTE